MTNSQEIEIAKLGKTVGLGGELKLYPLTDFLQQFKQGATFKLKNGKTVEIENYNEKRSLVKFYHYNVREDAAKLTNQILYTSKEESRENCDLQENQYFWFDIIGSQVDEEGRVLGIVIDIERIADTDYLRVKTADDLVGQKLSKEFLIPYLQDIYISYFDESKKILYTKDAYLLLEAS